MSAIAHYPAALSSLPQNINKLFINIVEQMLMDKPDNPVVYICSYLKKEYPEAFSVVEGDKAKVQETIDPLSDDEDDEDDDDVVDELPPMRARPAGRHGGAGRRVSVSAGVFDHRSLMASQFKAPINKKSDDAADGIRKILQNSLLFGHLDSTQMQTVVDAMFSKKFSNGDCIIEQGDTNADAYFVLNEGSAEVLKDGEKIVEYEAGSHAARFGYSMFFVCAIAPPLLIYSFPSHVSRASASSRSCTTRHAPRPCGQRRTSPCGPWTGIRSSRSSWPRRSRSAKTTKCFSASARCCKAWTTTSGARSQTRCRRSRTRPAT